MKYKHIFDNKYLIRPILVSDDHLQFQNLLSQLQPTTFDLSTFQNFVSSLSSAHNIYIIEDLSLNKIIASLTFILEHKLIHNSSYCLHIEDVVVDSNYRGLGLGKQLLSFIIQSFSSSTYKIILNCSQKNVPFYLKSGFHLHSQQMAIYNNFK
tara:strand:- start:36 stop:494 length:459 start_codon:yes stop_codon:yes gene_type:complete